MKNDDPRRTQFNDALYKLLGLYIYIYIYAKVRVFMRESLSWRDRRFDSVSTVPLFELPYDIATSFSSRTKAST